MKNAVIAIVALLLLAAGGFFVLNQSKTSDTEAEVMDEKTTMTDDAMVAEGDSMMEDDATQSADAMDGGSMMMDSYTLDQIAEHSTEDDCWFAIEGTVYDVTPYIAGGLHPGGEAILMGCGTDATELYNDRPNDEGPHSEKARSFLPQFEIGKLSQ